MLSSQLRDRRAKDEANELIKKFDKNGDGVLTKEELVGFFLHAARGSTQLNNQGCVSKFPKTNDNVTHKQAKKQSEDKAQKFSTRVLDGKTSDMPLSREEMKDIFKYHDSDKDGFLNIRELTKAFSFLGSIIPFYKAHYGLAYADVNKDGLISEAELDKLIDYAYKIIPKK